MHRNQKWNLKFLYPHHTDGGAGDGVSADPSAVTVSAGTESIDASVPMDVGTTTVTDENKPEFDFAKFIPEEHKDKPWVQNLLKAEKPNEEMFKQFDGLQTKLGQRPAGIPAEDAPPEEWKEFNKALGVPETPDEYDLKPTEFADEYKDISEFLNGARGSEEFQKDIKAMFHEVGIPPKKAQALLDKYDNIFVKHNKASFDAIAETQRADATKQAELDEDFNAKVTKEFGAKADNILDTGKKLIKQHVPESLRAAYDKLDNDSAVILAATIGAIAKNYVKEDDIDPKGDPGGQNATEARDELRKMMAMPAYNDVTDPGHEALVAKVTEGYARLFPPKK